MAKANDVPQFGLLNGLKVLSCGQVTAEPHATSLMAEHGADVIHVENCKSPEMTRGFAISFAQENRNKRNLAMNVPESKDVFDKLLQWADVWIESSKPGMYDKWGYTDEHVFELNPKLVVVHVSGYGHFGDPDYVPRPSMDVIGQAFSGLMALNGEKEPSAPLVSKPGICDYLTGLYAMWAALMGVYHAQKTGEGDVIDVSQYESCLRVQGYGPLMYTTTGEQLKRTGNKEATYAGIDVFECKDGNYCVVQVSGRPAAKAIAALLGLDDEEHFIEGRPTLNGTPQGDRLDGAIKAFCLERMPDEVETQLKAIGVACAPINNYEMLMSNPHVIARNDFVEWYDEASEQTLKGVAVLPPVKNNPGQIWRGAPKLGQDNEDILEELGYSNEEIEAMYAEGKIGKAE